MSTARSPLTRALLASPLSLTVLARALVQVLEMEMAVMETAQAQALVQVPVTALVTVLEMALEMALEMVPATAVALASENLASYTPNLTKGRKELSTSAYLSQHTTTVFSHSCPSFVSVAHSQAY